VSRLEVEVYGTGPFRWVAYRDVGRQVATGTARNRAALVLSLVWLAIRSPR
jgi:hypothetical protein